MISLSHPAVLSAMSGTTDGIFCRKFAEMGCGMVTLGGINADKATMGAARLLMEKGRQEFIFDDIGGWLSENIGEARKGGKPVLVNVRSASLSGFIEAASIIENEGGWVEINAHCRQEEMVEAGAGQSLLLHKEKLEKILSETRKRVECPLFLKFRGNVVDDGEILRIAEKHCDGIHVDATQMGVEKPDLPVFRRMGATSLFLIANNCIRDVRIAEETFPFCDAFSFARLSFTPKKAKLLLGKTSYYLFAYGTLTSKEKAESLVGHEVTMADAVLSNHARKRLGGISFAFPKRGAAIEGKLLRIRLSDLVKLDKYEGVEFGMYERICADVTSEDIKMKAYVYVAGKKMRG